MGANVMSSTGKQPLDVPDHGTRRQTRSKFVYSRLTLNNVDVQPAAQNMMRVAPNLRLTQQILRVRR